MLIEYDSNNSGGSFWLDDEHWLALEKAGWHVEWGRLWFCHSEFNLAGDRPPKALTVICAKKADCKGHRMFESLDEAKAAKGEFLGTYATCATIEAESLADAIRAWEATTGKSASDEGCNCCGPPHSFSIKDAPKDMAWEHRYASGSGVVGVLYDNAPKNLREAAERLKRGG